MKTIITRTHPDFVNNLINRMRMGELPQIAIGFPKEKCGGLQYPGGPRKRKGKKTKGKAPASPDASKPAKTPAEPPSVIDVAFWNNYGTDKIPARRFMDIGGKRCISQMKTMIAVCGEKMMAKKMTGKDAGEMLGEKAVAIMKKTIKSNIPPPNAKSTIKMKGSESTLIDTGLLMQSVTFAVRMVKNNKTKKGKK
jgi:hypothetical protein